MGTDIHATYEVKINGEWEWPYADLPKYTDASEFVKFPTDRNYQFFSMLANVRNSYEEDTDDKFAKWVTSVRTGKKPPSRGIVPICAPKGLPADISDALREAATNTWVLGDHSHSWLTHAELRAYGKEHFDYKNPSYTIRRGVVTPDEYLIFRLKGTPSSWSGGVGGVGVTMLSNAEMDDYVYKNLYAIMEAGAASRRNIALGRIYTTIEWEQTYLDAVGWEAASVFTRGIWHNVVSYHPEDTAQVEDVRVVFGFDS